MGSNSLFALWPYIAVALVVGGTLLRYLLVSRQPSVLAEEMADAKVAFAGRLFWISIFALLTGHLLGLLFPRAVLSWNSNIARLYLLEGLAFAVGLAGVASSAALIWRHLGQSTRSRVTELFDTVFLAIVFTVLVSGVLIPVLYRWGSSWGVMTLGPYVASIVGGQPAVQLVKQMPTLVQLHVLATFAAIAVVPLTRLSTFLIAAMHGCIVLIGRPFRAAANAVTEWSHKHNPGSWFWPEED
ncbi:MAG: respiratory nitrate reductase subunit gamma [Terracidiphilus sp.]|jgi:nitrate reductase gamma subunit